MLFEGYFAAFPVRIPVDERIGNKQVVVVPVAGGFIAVICANTHASAFVGHEGVVQHKIVVGCVDQQARGRKTLARHIGPL